MFDFKTIILGFTLLSNLFLGGMVISKDWRNKFNIFFSLFILSISLWTLSMLMFRIPANDFVSTFWLRLSYLTAGIIAISFFAFTVALTKEPIHKIVWVFIILTTLGMSLLILQPWFLIRDIVTDAGEKMALTFTFDYILYSFYFCIFFFGSLLLIWRKYKKETGLEKTKLAYVLWGVFLGGLFGSFFNLILPSPWLNEWRFTWVGPIFSFLIIFFVTMNIIKYKFMNIRVMAVELFILIILIITGSQIFFSDNLNKFLLNILIFIFILFFAILLIRNELREIRRHEQIQQLAAELKSANKRLKQLDELKSDFISIASHQFRTPLTTIKGLTSMMLEGFWEKYNKKSKEQLKKVFLSAQRLLMLVEDLLNISRIESGRMVFSFEPTDLAALAESVINEVRSLAENKQLALRLKKPRTALPPIKIDPLKIRQAMMNLIDNAIHYTAKRGKITISLTQKNKKEIFSVTDTGIGFLPETRAMLFKKFSRDKQSSQMHTEGSGIGLYVAAKIIEAHRGKIGAKSPGANQGSTFWFSLPIT